MDPKTTAVVLIEFQNDFTSEGGSLHAAVKGVMEQNNTLANAVELAKQARELGATIIHVPISFAEGYPELPTSPYGILKGVVDSSSFRKGTWGAEIVDLLTPQAGDLVVEGKRGLCGFASTNLDFILRQRGVKTVALAGFLTNCCVESSMRAAYELGYNVVTVTDCTATLSPEEQTMAVTKDFPMFSHPMGHEDFLAALAGAQPVAASDRGYEA
jgi:ureidoacrylate peracid hydrolase